MVGVGEASDEQYRACAPAALELYRAAEGRIAVQLERTVEFQATFPLAMYALNQVCASLGDVNLGWPRRDRGMWHRPASVVCQRWVGVVDLLRRTASGSASAVGDVA